MKTQKEFLDVIQSLPHRGIGTEYERKAAEKLVVEYERMGLKPKLQRFQIFKHNWLAYLVEFLLFGLSGISLLLGFGFLSMIFLALGSVSFFGFPIQVEKLYKVFFPAKSQNVSVEIPSKGKSVKTLVVCAHYDTGKVIIGAKIFAKFFEFLLGKNDFKDGQTLNIKFLPKFFLTPAFLTDSMVFAQVLAILLFYVNSDLFYIFAVYNTFWSIAHLLFVFHVMISPFVPGALDNGSSVVVSMRLAQYFRKNPLGNTRLVILNEGAEETRIAEKGIRTFFIKMRYDKESTYFLNLECLGSENIVYTEGESDNNNGIHMSDEKSFQFLVDFVKREKHVSESSFCYLPIASDASALEDEGAKVITTMLSMEKTGMDKNYHTMHDTVENLNLDTMKRAEEILKDFVVEFDHEFTVDKA